MIKKELKEAVSAYKEQERLKIGYIKNLQNKINEKMKNQRMVVV